MDYYSTLATVIPLLYVALALEGRVHRDPIVKPGQGPMDVNAFEVLAHVLARVSVLIGLPLVEAGLLTGLARGEQLEVVDVYAPSVVFVATVVLICPPIWREIEQFVPEHHRESGRRTSEFVVGATALAVMLPFSPFYLFPAL